MVMRKSVREWQESNFNVIVSKIVDGGKVDLDNWLVWFRPNEFGYDDIRFADRESFKTQILVEVNVKWNHRRYAVYVPENHFANSVFETDSEDELIEYLNKK
jgi:hypothetical protein